MNSNPDSGTAYALPQPTYHQELTEVRPDTPMGELLRRYWLPVGLSADACDLPKPVRALAEDLILFRDQSGRPGLVHSRCNIHDPGHFLWKHYFHNGPQFGSRYGELDKLDFQPWERLVDLKYRMTPRGVTSEHVQTLPDGRRLRTAVETVLPAFGDRSLRFPSSRRSHSNSCPAQESKQALICLHDRSGSLTSNSTAGMPSAWAPRTLRA
jgi:hypothetical protein